MRRRLGSGGTSRSGRISRCGARALRRAFNASSDSRRRLAEPTPPSASTPGDVNAAERLLRIIHLRGPPEAPAARGPSVLAEIARLRAENAELRAANERLSPVAAPAPPARAEASLDDLPPLVDAARPAACDEGRDGPLLISVLFFEKQSYVDGALRNLLAFTLPTTNVVVHLAADSDARLRNASRVVVNPERAHVLELRHGHAAARVKYPLRRVDGRRVRSCGAPRELEPPLRGGRRP